MTHRRAPRARQAIARGALAVLAVVLAACKGGRRESPPQEAAPPTPADAATADANLEACRQAAARAPSLPAAERASALLDACRPCGDWEPLLSWNTPVTDGGPPRAAIERAMAACNAYCQPGARQRFLGTLDEARGQPTRTPWRLLGEICGDAVSAVPDARFMGAPYFALDRIARAIGDPAVLAAIEIPLPALTISGVGVDLPPAPAAPPTVDAGPAALTVDAAQILLGVLPVGKLSATGVAVTGDYPGAAIEPRALAAALARAAPDGHPVAVL
ncbi:MAG TPA: hypothetical protein VFT22_37270, partial [Kofleriaceae bacterium]|nr:hypothetical protein [Kofleriaceae bacterium]